jgi:hypothetical protein
MLKRYGLEKATFNSKYKSKIAKWYKKYLRAQAYNAAFTEPKPKTPE